MNPTSTNSGLVPNETPDFVIDESAKSVWLGAQRCHLGDTDQFSLMHTLGLYRNCPVEHVRMLREIDRSDLSPNELRRIVYRLKQRLRKYGLGEVADSIKNVRGAYTLEWTKEVTFQGTDTQERTMGPATTLIRSDCLLRRNTYLGSEMDQVG
jgi:hypothetical protein